ncbi:peptidoglycan-binding protein [Sphaerisporangium siamense]|uniref:Biotin carboxyl carrier protein n=1 Tax=Sphaerisporangium siamense TaxID=795645 RepID=A0A7W7D8X1_9ACTN|nr:peptidoglycan-binding protein [Sphaerisporangium siamense]MBB4701555.1 biotin carboxyl carrier protein [Sphaerisporangium siamense]GII85681.1 peptidoglycan-binding protein [Sphaerisporangium siamense]
MGVRRLAAVSAGVTAVLAGAATAAVMSTGTGTAEAPPKAAPSRTAEVTRGDLVDTTTVDGSLTYTGERRVYAGAAGTVTAVAGEGTTISRGRALLKVDRRPLVLMYGALPLYRPLSIGVSDGPDVRQLERNLKALGYGDDMTVDDEFTYATRRAVLDWQEDRGLVETGQVDAGQVVFLPGPVRVSRADVEVGDPVNPGRRVLAVTSTRRTVHVDLDTDDQSMARKGAPVTIELPGGARVKGTISEVGTVARASGDDAGQGGGDATIDVEISLRSAAKVGRLDQAPVSVAMESERVKDVLSVPVEALLALAEGGFGVEVAEGSGTRVVAVETGAYGGGRVEVSGDGLAAGMKVGVPDR